MSPTQQLQAYAQSIYLILKNRYFDDIEGTDGQAYIDKIIDWTTMFVDELTNTIDSDGDLVDWWFQRENGAALGTATEGAASIDMPSGIDRLLTDEQRYVQIKQDNLVISNWAVVAPKNITNISTRITEDTCAVVGSSLVFSRTFRDTENNGSIVGDVVNLLPTLSRTNIKLLGIVKPFTLLKLGVAKNAVLPDIVQGALTPSYSGKFDTLMAGAIARSTASARGAEATRQSFKGVGGIYHG